MSRRPHPAPMRRSPALLSATRPLPGPALTGPWPTVTRSQGARHAASPSLPRAAARSHRAPSPEYRPAAARTHWARLVRIATIACRRPHRIYPAACRHPHPPMSPLSRFRAHRPPITPSCAAVLYVLHFAAPIAPAARRRPRPPSRVASVPGPWLARIALHASPFSRMREKGPLPGSIRPKCMLFEIKMATSSPHASISGRNRAIQDTWRANLAAKGPLSRRGTRNHARREDVASAARDFRGSGLRSGRTGFAPCGSGMRHAAWPNRLCALRRGPGLLAACAPPAISLVPAARVHRRRLTRVALRRPHRAHARRHPPRRPLRSG